ncbi:MAG: hypothetical protein COZ18_09395 [Flexibacter sp. CG_4_10_14_3_um_filter_32_15]|nr:MAG: hypothetical protein COZ18_09395 [Flexibacter sp. CG_4_10_14_3_um_filter_32_15]
MKKIFLLFLFSNIVFFAKAQFTNIDLLLINDSLSYSMDLEEIQRFIKIDSITPVPSIMDASMADSLVFLGSSYLSFYKKGNEEFIELNEPICMFETIIFDEKIKSITLDKKNKITTETTFEEIKKIFPSNCQNVKEMSIYGDKTKYKSCSVGFVSGGLELDTQLIFFFSDNKVKRIDFWNPT